MALPSFLNSRKLSNQQSGSTAALSAQQNAINQAYSDLSQNTQGALGNIYATTGSTWTTVGSGVSTEARLIKIEKMLEELLKEKIAFKNLKK